VLILKKGDVIELGDGILGESVMSGDWGEGLCERTRMKGCFPVESVYVLPAIKQPTSDILVSNLYYTITVFVKLQTVGLILYINMIDAVCPNSFQTDAHVLFPIMLQLHDGWTWFNTCSFPLTFWHRSFTFNSNKSPT